MNQTTVNNQTSANNPFSERFGTVIQRASEYLLAGASAATSSLGALEMVSDYKPVAIAFALGLNASLYASAHSLNSARVLPSGYKYPQLPQVGVWLLTLGFSVWLSYAGFFKMYLSSFTSADQQRAVQEVAHDAAAKLNELKSQMLGHLNEQSPSVTAAFANETRRVEFARRKALPVSTNKLEMLRAKKQQLEQAIEKLDQWKLLESSKLGGTPEAARQELREAFERAAVAHASLPEAFRQAHPLPQLQREASVPTSLLNVAWAQLQKGDTTAWCLLCIALAIDLCATLSVRSRTPKRRAAKGIRDGRLWAGDLWRALFRRLSVKLRKVRLVVMEYGQLDLEVAFGQDLKTVFLRDLQCHFETVEREVGKFTGQAMRVVSCASSSGAELLTDELPLSAQLDEDFTIYLRLEAVEQGVRQ